MSDQIWKEMGNILEEIQKLKNEKKQETKEVIEARLILIEELDRYARNQRDQQEELKELTKRIEKLEADMTNTQDLLNRIGSETRKDHDEIKNRLAEIHAHTNNQITEIEIEMDKRQQETREKMLFVKGKITTIIQLMQGMINGQR